MERYNSYELLNTVVHETRHAYQHAAIDNPNLYVVSNETISQWKNNIDDYTKPVEGYNSYYEQPIEWDANGFVGKLDKNNHNPQYAGSW